MRLSMVHMCATFLSGNTQSSLKTADTTRRSRGRITSPVRYAVKSTYTHSLSSRSCEQYEEKRACESHTSTLFVVCLCLLCSIACPLCLSLSLSLCLCDRNAVWHSIPTPEGMTMFYQCVEENCGHKWKDESV